MFQVFNVYALQVKLESYQNEKDLIWNEKFVSITQFFFFSYIFYKCFTIED